MPLLSPLPFRSQSVIDRVVGLDQWLQAAARSGAAYDTGKIDLLIPGWIRRFEEQAQYHVHPMQVVSNPDGTYNSPDMTTDLSGTYELLVDPPYPYYAETAMKFLRASLRRYPVRNVQRLRLMLSPDVSVLSIPPSWFRFQKTGQFNIMPVSGTLAIGGGYLAASVLDMGFGGQGYVPQLMAFDYLVGLPDNWQTLRIYSALQYALQQYCAAFLCEDICETFSAGMPQVSISVDGGASQTWDYDRFQGKKKSLLDQAMEYQDILIRNEQPVYLGAG